MEELRLFLWLGQFPCLAGWGQVVGGFGGRDDGMAELRLEFVTGNLGYAGAFPGYLGTLAIALGGLLFGQVGGGALCQHIEDELGVGHIIAQALLFQTFELLILSGGLAAPFLGDDVG